VFVPAAVVAATPVPAAFVPAATAEREALGLVFEASAPAPDCSGWVALGGGVVEDPPSVFRGASTAFTTCDAGEGSTDAADRPVAVAKTLATDATPTSTERRFRRARGSGHDREEVR
jgi:hypothetical protein